ncbi:MAG: hypothetical protein DI586_10830, partial [Micavibrio aeruginosavorus]
TVKITLEDTILAEMVTEQLSRLPGVAISDSDAADLVISRVKTPENVPHLLLGGKAEEGCEVLPMPVRLGDLTDRVRYILSGRNRFARSSIVEFAGFTLSTEDGMMSDDKSDKQVRLTDKEKLMIVSLFEEPTKSLDRQGLLQKVWGYADTAETHTLETHLYRLRQKLEESLDAKDLIVTKDGIYTLKI